MGPSKLQRSYKGFPHINTYSTLLLFIFNGLVVVFDGKSQNIEKELSYRFTISLFDVMSHSNENIRGHLYIKPERNGVWNLIQHLAPVS